MSLIGLGALFTGVLFILQVTGIVASLTVMQILAPLIISIGIMAVIWIAMVIFALIFG